MLRIKLTPGAEKDTCYRIKINNEIIDTGILYTNDTMLEYKGIFVDPRESIDFVSISCTNFYAGRKIFIQEIQVNDVVITAGRNFGHKHIVSGCSKNIQQVMEGDYSDIVTMDRAGGMGDWIFIVSPNGSVAFWDKKLYFENERLTFTYVIKEKNTYYGEVNAKGKAHGQGTYIWDEGDIYDGEWKNSKMHGQGTKTWPNGDQYVGEFKNSVYNGQGTMTWADGRKHVGEWKDGKKHGQGTYTPASGGTYVGQWKDDKRHGLGIETWADGTEYAEEWKNNERINQEPADAQKTKEILNELKKRNDSS